MSTTDLLAFPVGLRLTGRRCLVVGASDEASQRAQLLSSFGALVTVTSSEPSEAELSDVWLVVQADRDAALAERLAAYCDARRIFFCAVDQPEYSSFSHLALARAGDVIVAVSSSGSAPALSRRLRQELERVFAAAGLSDFAEQLAQLRRRLDPRTRARTLSELVQGVRFDGCLQLPDLAAHSNNGASGGPGMGGGGG